MTVGADALLFRSEQLAVALNAVTVFTTGVYLRFEVLRRRTPAVRPHPALSALSPLSREAEGDRAVAPPRVSVTVADGRSAVCTGGSRPPQGTTSADPALVCTHTSGHETREAIHYLLTPLPSPGPIVIALVWPEQGIPQTSLALDGDEVMAAAARVVTLWPGRAPRRRPPADPNGPVNN